MLYTFLDQSRRKTDSLAQTLFSSLDRSLVYRFDKVCDLPMPYKVHAVKQRINLGPFDILALLQRTNCMLLIGENNFRFFIKQETFIHELTEQELSKIDSKSDDNEEYVIFFSTTCLVHRLNVINKNIPEEKEPIQFYHYCSKQEFLTSKAAPFHHETQRQGSSLCGMHALNAYMGCRYLSPQNLRPLILSWFAMTAGYDVRDYDIETGGLEPAMLDFVIEHIAKSGKVPSVTHKAKIITCACKPTRLGDAFSAHENDILTDFKSVDRFILGIAKTQAHFLTFRKDEQQVWWKIDSMLGEQEAFETAYALIEEIKSTYVNDLLHFIIPDLTKRIIPPRQIM